MAAVNSYCNGLLLCTGYVGFYVPNLSRIWSPIWSPRPRNPRIWSPIWSPNLILNHKILNPRSQNYFESQPWKTVESARNLKTRWNFFQREISTMILQRHCKFDWYKINRGHLVALQQWPEKLQEWPQDCRGLRLKKYVVRKKKKIGTLLHRSTQEFKTKIEMDILLVTTFLHKWIIFSPQTPS